MDAGFDTGNLLAQVSVPLADDDTEETLFAQFGATAAALLPVALDRLARGDRGDRQEGGEYQSMFEDEYRTIDLSNTAASVHRQVRAWSFMPPVAEFGPFLERAATASR